MTNKLVSIVGIILISLSLISAQEIVTNEDVLLAGITPDSAFYGIELAFEKIIEIFGENARIRHTQERLAEMKVMIAANKLEEAKIAFQNFEKARLRLRNQNMLEEHKKLADNLGSEISKIASNKKLTEMERTQIKNLIQEHKQKIDKESIEIIAETKKINEKQAEQLMSQERLKIQQRITNHLRERIDGLNNQKIDIRR